MISNIDNANKKYTLGTKFKLFLKWAGVVVFGGLSIACALAVLVVAINFWFLLFGYPLNVLIPFLQFLAPVLTSFLWAFLGPLVLLGIGLVFYFIVLKISKWEIKLEYVSNKQISEEENKEENRNEKEKENKDKNKDIEIKTEDNINIINEINKDKKEKENRNENNKKKGENKIDSAENIGQVEKGIDKNKSENEIKDINNIKTEDKAKDRNKEDNKDENKENENEDKIKDNKNEEDENKINEIKTENNSINNEIDKDKKEEKKKEENNNNNITNESKSENQNIIIKENNNVIGDKKEGNIDKINNEIKKEKKENTFSIEFCNSSFEEDEENQQFSSKKQYIPYETINWDPNQVIAKYDFANNSSLDLLDLNPDANILTSNSSVQPLNKFTSNKKPLVLWSTNRCYYEPIFDAMYNRKQTKTTYQNIHINPTNNSFGFFNSVLNKNENSNLDLEPLQTSVVNEMPYKKLFGGFENGINKNIVSNTIKDKSSNLYQELLRTPIVTEVSPKKLFNEINNDILYAPKQENDVYSRKSEYI